MKQFIRTYRDELKKKAVYILMYQFRCNDLKERENLRERYDMMPLSDVRKHYADMVRRKVLVNKILAKRNEIEGGRADYSTRMSRRERYGKMSFEGLTDEYNRIVSNNDTADAENEERARQAREDYARRMQISIAEQEQEQRNQEQGFTLEAYKKAVQGKTYVKSKKRILGANVEEILIYEYKRVVYMMTGRDIEVEGNTLLALKNIARWLSNPPKFGLILCGGVGVGKTTATIAIKNMYQNCNKEEVTCVRADDIDKMKDENVVALSKSNILIIDDLGTDVVDTKEYGDPRTPMIRLINLVYDRRGVLIITTNKTMEGLEKRYSERTADRLHELCNVVQMGGVTYRRNNNNKSK